MTSNPGEGHGVESTSSRPAGIKSPPDVISKFLTTEGTTLLVKGYAGSGKTTLALQLLSALSKRDKGVYISSRVSENKLQHQLSWWGGTGKTKENERTEFIDIRLGTAESMLEEILETIVSEQRDSGLNMVVLDTWDGLAKEMEEKERLKAEKTLVALADSTKARMVFVSEEPGKTTMDYLVDGIVELVRAEEYNRIFREIEIQKLRGTLISQHKYLYTLLGGRFRHFEPYSPPAHPVGKWFKPIEDTEDAFSYGSPDMDLEFGGLGKGSTSVFEYDGNVPYTALRLVETPAIVNALNFGRGVVCVPLPGAGTENLASAIMRATSEADVRERLILTSQGDPATLKAPFYGVGTVDPVKAGQRISEFMEMVRGKSKRGGVLAVGSVGALEGAFASKLDALLEQVSFLISNIQVRSIDTLLLFMPADALLRARLIAMSREHARFFIKDGSAMLMGEKPRTGAMVLEHSPEDPELPRLTRIV